MTVLDESPVSAGPLSGRVILVAGASTGIGFATARLLGAAGGRLILSARGKDQLERAAALIRTESGAVVWTSPRDLTRQPEVCRLIQESVDQFGALHVVVQAIGGGGGGATTQLGHREWHEVLAMNLHTSYLLGTEAFPYIRESGGGEVVFLGSVTAVDAMVKRLPTTVAKHALRGLVETLRTEWMSHGVSVTMVHPGLIATGRFGGLDTTTSGSRAMTEEGSGSLIGLGRLGTPEEVAMVVRKAIRMAPIVPEWIVDGGWQAGGLRVPVTLA